MDYSRGALIVFFEKATQVLCEHQSFWSLADGAKSEQIIQLIMEQEDALWKNTDWWRGIEEARASNGLNKE